VCNKFFGPEKGLWLLFGLVNLLGAGVFGDSLGSFGDGVFGQFSEKSLFIKLSAGLRDPPIISLHFPHSSPLSPLQQRRLLKSRVGTQEFQYDKTLLLLVHCWVIITLFL
jgi:hypothetical protein